MSSALVCVYRATTGVQAHMARVALTRYGLWSVVRNELSAAAMAPLNQIQAEVWVRADDADDARSVLVDLDRPPEGRGRLSLSALSDNEGALSLSEAQDGELSEAGERPCPACGAPNPPGVEICWACEAALPEPPR